MIEDISQIGNENRSIACLKDDLARITDMTENAKKLNIPDAWSWAASDDSDRGRCNIALMEYWVKQDLRTKIITCSECKTASILIGEETESPICHDCISLDKKNESFKTEVKNVWDKVRPKSNEFPNRVDEGHTDKNLPNLAPGEKAVISPVHPVVTEKKFICLP